ncbi:hypothetical protein LP420_32310 [Massilia sp. B-10]|nr:hypothetical protein LP420_32310 [Massilia sp. B-10]
MTATSTSRSLVDHGLAPEVLRLHLDRALVGQRTAPLFLGLVQAAIDEKLGVADLLARGKLRLDGGTLGLDFLEAGLASATEVDGATTGVMFGGSSTVVQAASPATAASRSPLRRTRSSNGCIILFILVC